MLMNQKAPIAVAVIVAIIVVIASNYYGFVIPTDEESFGEFIIKHNLLWPFMILFVSMVGATLYVKNRDNKCKVTLLIKKLSANINDLVSVSVGIQSKQENIEGWDICLEQYRQLKTASELRRESVTIIAIEWKTKPMEFIVIERSDPMLFSKITSLRKFVLQRGLKYTDYRLKTNFATLTILVIFLAIILVILVYFFRKQLGIA